MYKKLFYFVFGVGVADGGEHRCRRAGCVLSAKLSRRATDGKEQVS